jgi:hypothetical protein
MNRAERKGDSKADASVKIDKAFVIQNLFAKLSKSSRSQDFFFNYPLDSDLFPMRRKTYGEASAMH